jgi:hypothetical protein
LFTDKSSIDQNFQCILHSTHRNFGPFCYAGAFLEEGAPDFGPNPALLFVKPHFRNVKGWDGFPQILDGYNAQLSKLPKVKVLNKMKLVEIEYVSNVCMGDDLDDAPYNPQTGFNSNWRNDLERRRHTYDAQLLQRFCSELLEILPTFRKRLAKVDYFNFDSFLEWAALRFKDLPSTDESLKEYAIALNSKPEESKKTESWEDLHIDWSEYHPQARETLDDLFYWDCVNEYAPHGNDEERTCWSTSSVGARETTPVTARNFSSVSCRSGECRIIPRTNCMTHTNSASLVSLLRI